MRKKNFLVISLLLLLAFISPQNINAAVEVSNDMTNEEIQNVISENDIITFKEGTYQNISLVLSSNKTLIASGKVEFVKDESTLIKNEKSNGVINDNNAITLNAGVEISFNSNDNSGFYISGYGRGISGKLGNNTINLTGGILSITGSVNCGTVASGNGIYLAGEGTSTINVLNNSTLISSDNIHSGIEFSGPYAAEGEILEKAKLHAVINVISSSLYLNNNRDDNWNGGSGIHMGTDGTVSSVITMDNVKKVEINNNAVDAICNNDGINGNNVLIIKNTKADANGNAKIQMNNNGSWGINGHIHYITDSVVDVNGNGHAPWEYVNKSASNMYAYESYITNSTVNANDAMTFSGIWVASNLEWKDSIVNLNNNGKKDDAGNIDASVERGYGLFSRGTSFISNTKINANGNGNIGIYFWPAANTGKTTTKIENNSIINAAGNRATGIVFRGVEDTYQAIIKDSTINTTNNGLGQDLESTTSASWVSGISALSNTYIDNCVLNLIEKGYALGFYSQKDSTSGLVILDDFIINGTTVAIFEGEKFDSRSNQMVHTLRVISGSLQADIIKMSGKYSYDDTWNTKKLDSEIYSGPINNEGTKLVRFNLNKEINKEANGDINIIIYYDPNNGTEYQYKFRYNKENEDLNEDEKDNAYVWTPVSVVNYDSTEGYIDYGNSTAGSLIMGSSITNQENNGKNDRYTSDITIIGNSLNLAEKIMPKAIRNGYIFLGWFYPNAEDAELASEYAKNGDFNNLYKLLVNPFNESTKILRDMNDISSAMGEITIYAKWAKLEDNIDKSGSDTVTSNTDAFDYNIKYSATVSEYSGDVTIMITDILQYSILEDMSDIDISNIILNHNYKYDITTKYDEVLKRIVWIINIYDVNTYENGILTIDIDKNLKLYYLNIDKSVVEVENIVKSSLIITNNDEDMIVSEKEDNHVTAILYKGGDIEELPPQTGVNSSNSLLSPILLMLLLIIRRVIK